MYSNISGDCSLVQLVIIFFSSSRQLGMGILVLLTLLWALGSSDVPCTATIARAADGNVCSVS